MLSCCCDPTAVFDCCAQKEEGFCTTRGKELGGKVVQAEVMELTRLSSSVFMDHVPPTEDWPLPSSAAFSGGSEYFCGSKCYFLARPDFNFIFLVRGKQSKRNQCVAPSGLLLSTGING